eukprot:FR744404.1.p3 GENE.FR744404.1~~FR744404.1.p3  ORF type:complete len:116 (+),score=21.22 FR744404.1:683-1030(+)
MVIVGAAFFDFLLASKVGLPKGIGCLGMVTAIGCLAWGLVTPNTWLWGSASAVEFGFRETARPFSPKIGLTVPQGKCPKKIREPRFARGGLPCGPSFGPFGVFWVSLPPPRGVLN